MNPSPTIVAADGKPAFVVLPYAEYLALIRAYNAPRRHRVRIPADGSIPHEVFLLMTLNDWSVIRAWRKFLGMTRAQMADGLDIRRSSYTAMEATGARLNKDTREQIAVLLGLRFDQCDV
ncbi:hypothetical protein LMG26690_03626 [Achromobacter animicus]|uniref:HTH cro/C1-type domain-containing protein n=1 Tax=Achromobacter animicus TaxID=1389935 RepID=A0A6S7AFS3_9BURK|nr:helix-turn-helix transcriptional regulator [Achromobacter animicus]CAB3717480.1 hypothetical protein LMG26690_03626 [Achromobacter animicus]